MEVFRLFGSFFVKDESSNALDSIEKKAEEADSKISKLETVFKKVGETVTTMGNKITDYGSGSFSTAKNSAKSFQTSTENLNIKMQALKSELDLASASTDKFGKTSDSLRVKQDLLSKQLDVQKQIIKSLESEYENSAQAKGIDDKATQELAIELNKAKTEYATLAKEVNNTTKEITTQSEKFKAAGDKLKQIGEGVTRVGQKLTTFITVPLVGAGAASFKFASDLSESINKVEVAFKDSSSTVEKWSDTTLNSFGIAKGSSLDMAALFGDMATSMGIGTKKAADMSMSLVGLAGDLASFKNIGIDEATTALNAIFTGETESLKRLGIVMTETNLQQFAYSQGIKKKVQDMTEAEKVQLRYNYVMDKSKNAQGDFIRTSDGAANQMRIFTESLKELGSSFGQYLLPMITPVIKNINEFVKYIGSLDEKTKKTIITVAGILAVVGPIIFGIGSLITTIGGLITAFSVIAGVVGISVGAVAAIAAVIPIVIAAIVGLAIIIYKNWDSIKKWCSDLWRSIVSIWNSIVTSITTFVSNLVSSIVQFFSNLWNNITAIMSSIWNTLVNIWMSIYNSVMAVVTPILNFISGVFKAIFTVIEAVGKLILASIILVWNAIYTTIQPIIQGIFSFIANIFNSIFIFLAGIWNSIYSTVSGFVTMVYNIISSVFSSVYSYVSGIFNSVFSVISGIWNSIYSYFSGIVTSIYNTIYNGFNNAKNGIINIFSGLKSTIMNIFGGIWGGVKSIINGGIRLVNDFIGGVNVVIKKANKVPGVNLGAVDTIPMLATGGTVLNGDAIVGEAGAELLRVRNGKTSVIPLTNQERKGGQDYTSNLNNDNSSMVELLKAILEWIKIIANNPSEFDVDGKKLWESLSPYAALATKRRG